MQLCNGREHSAGIVFQLARSQHTLTGRTSSMKYEGDAPLSNKETGRSLCVRFIFGSSSKNTGDSLKFMIYTHIMRIRWHASAGRQKQNVMLRQHSNEVERVLESPSYGFAYLLRPHLIRSSTSPPCPALGRSACLQAGQRQFAMQKLNVRTCMNTNLI